MTDPIETLCVEFRFRDRRPGFGDLFRLCGTDHPNFPPDGAIDFRPFADLALSQVDDYSGVRTTSGGGADVAIWLSPMIGGDIVDHTPGPFDGVRLDYDLLRNPADRLDHYIRMPEAFATGLPADLLYDGAPAPVQRIRSDADAALAAWRANGIEPGSVQAMTLDT